MSRCFPYPPPGYSPKRDNNEALIESIKLQKEREKSKSERKERKREKKEKKREHRAIVEQHVTEFNHGRKRKHDDEKAYKSDKVKVDLKGYYKSTEDEAEEVERSGLTEEHEQPVCSHNACDSSDSTKNCEKRRQASPGRRIQAHGNILRIRLPSRKFKEPDANVGDERSCSTSGRIHKEPDPAVGCSTSGRKELMGMHGFEVGPACSRLESCSISLKSPPCQQESCSKSLKFNASGQGFTPGVDGKQSSASAPSTSCGTFAPDDGRTTQPTTVDNRMKKIESLYKNLVGNLDLPPLGEGMQASHDELEWLCQRTQQDRKRSKASNMALSDGKPVSAFWPRAQYLAEADVYALPFALPF
ncbi:uncharacterized protein LOC127808798 isoform X2 [Diospyros lotus]|uniref:uncharacterized protein LOC127808798 isoform X2 n=1 Tax=Diospyros lotus TaxID=55363 RepID=UPI002254C027|nr:uncharacterized protein LOC127808798 isoform X2 [Diospyros lotus]